VLESKVNDSINNSNRIEFLEFQQDSIISTKIKEYSIKRLQGSDEYDCITNIYYKNLHQILSEINTKSVKEMWTAQEKQTKIEAYKFSCKGGQINLHINRLSLGSANTNMFSIIIKDCNENELFRYNFDSSLPSYGSSGYWRNYGICFVNKTIKAPFYVYVIDKMSDSPFKFEITPIMYNKK